MFSAANEISPSIWNTYVLLYRVFIQHTLKKSLAGSTQSGYKKKKKWIRHSYGPWEAY